MSQPLTGVTNTNGHQQTHSLIDQTSTEELSNESLQMTRHQQFLSTTGSCTLVRYLSGGLVWSLFLCIHVSMRIYPFKVTNVLRQDTPDAEVTCIKRLTVCELAILILHDKSFQILYNQKLAS